MTREEAIEVFNELKKCYLGGIVDAIDMAIEALKAQEPIEARLNLCESCAKEYAECEADKTDLVYGSGVGNDNIIGCSWYANRWKAQEPVKPSIDSDADGMHGNWWYTCGVCHEQIDRDDKYCRWCGRAVKWNG